MNLMNTKVMVSKIGQATVRPSSKKDPFVAEEQCYMLYYVGLVETGYLEDVQRLKV